MIKFFRRIRQNLISENRFSKYLLYAVGEIILVVVGILIALQINNWNQYKLNRQKEAIYLSQLKEGLEYDLNKEFIPAVSIYSKIVKGADHILGFNEDTRGIPSDSLAIHFRWCTTQEWDFIFNMAGYENLKSMGMDLISNDLIRSRISTLYSHSYANIREVNQNYIKYWDHQVSPLIFKNFTLSRDSLTTNELQLLKENNHIKKTLSHLEKRRRWFLNNQLIPIKEELESLTKGIELELEKLNNND